MLRMPVFGPLLRGFILARFSRALAVMLRNGVPTVEALQIAAAVAKDEVYRQHIQLMRLNVVEGTPMFSVLLQHPRDFPEAYMQQFRAAEEKSILNNSMVYLGEILNDEVTTSAEGLAAAIEPLMMVALGVVVGVLVLAVFSPMTTMLRALQK
ncbi:MAG: type II secretion system F family protein [Deinococcota bacterium]